MKLWVKRALGVGCVALLVGVAADLVRSVAPKPRPDFTGRDLQGRTWSLAEHRGNHPVLVSFFATWCGPCMMEAPELVQLYQKYRDRGLELVFVSPEPEADVRRSEFFSSLPATVVAGAADVHKLYGVESLPHVVLFNRRGEVAADISGYSPETVRELERKVAGDLGQAAAQRNPRWTMGSLEGGMTRISGSRIVPESRRNASAAGG